MPRSLKLLALSVPVLFVACGGETPPPAPPPPAAPPPRPASRLLCAPTQPWPRSCGVLSAPPPRGASPAPTPAVKYTGFQTPESVLYDEGADRYLVSNINGNTTTVDNNGFISVLSPDGQVTSLKWIEGGKNKVKLDGPKGMAIAKGVLYVADITQVRMFDAKTGAPKGDVKIAGSTFLNDIAAGPDGKVYASDSGLKVGASGFEPTGTDAVYVIEGGKA